MAANASELYHEMRASIGIFIRTTTDLASPMKQPVQEAPVGRSFKLNSILHNVTDFRSLDLRWAYANVLHFFAGTEEAAPLVKYNKEAARFLTGGRWLGAYGAIAMPQIGQCVDLLRVSPDTRRAIVSMGGFCEEPDQNRPACWSFLHFLKQDELHMVVYQRSLHLSRVMPYDCILLTNILNYVAFLSGMKPGTLTWVIGSLHDSPGDLYRTAQRNITALLPTSILMSSETCYKLLEQPQVFQGPTAYVLQQPEART